MLNEIKTKLLDNPETIVTLLENFGFEHITPRTTEIRFARSYEGGANISIRLKNNPYCCVSDFARGVHTDIISYIIKEKKVAFREVLQEIKRILGLNDDWEPRQVRKLFGGIFDNISRPSREIRLKTYDESVLDEYESCGNLRFLRDGISLLTQKAWNIRFSVDDNAIIIPLYNEYGELVGAKSRINGEPQEGESKYYYKIPTQASQTLYGYANNYPYLYGNDVIVVESEKSVLQAYTFNVRNIVGLGSSSVSEKQSKLLLQLQPKRIILAFDEGLEFEQIQRNADMIKNCCAMFGTEIWYWDYTQNLDVNFKDSPTDNGLITFKEIMEEQLVRLY